MVSLTTIKRYGAWLAAACLALSATGCKGPCDELAERMCELNPNDGEQCEKWQVRTKRVPTETCEAGLRQLDRDRVR